MSSIPRLVVNTEKTVITKKEHVYPCAESKDLSRVRRPTYFMKNKEYSSQMNDKIALLTSSDIRNGTMSSIYDTVLSLLTEDFPHDNIASLFSATC